MPKHLDEQDKKILSVAKELFLSIGIRKTEMKDIAVRAGIGRSTLYRHFSCKEQIAFYIAKEILVELSNWIGVGKELTNSNGFEKISYELKAFLKHLIASPNHMRFLDEFDQLFTDNYPELEEASEYTEFNKRKHSFFIDYLHEGMEDGSIRTIENPEFEVDVIINMTFGIAQRIIPRSHHYVEEHGFYEEILEKAIQIILRSLQR